jgi:hypothetical protein
MAETKHVFSGRIPDPPFDPFWFPYTSKGYRWQLRAFRALFSGGGVVKKLREFL